MEENRKKALAAALSQIEKQFGKGSVMRLGEAGATYEVDSIPTGSLGLDIALGVGGIPKGRVIEIFGPESSGKTTLTLSIGGHSRIVIVHVPSNYKGSTKVPLVLNMHGSGSTARLGGQGQAIS